MATARGRGEWSRTIVTVQYVVASMSGQKVAATDIAPAWVFPPPPPAKKLTPEEEWARDDFNMRCLQQAITFLYGG